MNGNSVAIVCRQRENAQRLLHCLEFLGVEACVRSPEEPIADEVVITDCARLTVADEAALLRIGDGPDAAGPAPTVASLSWPPRYDELTAGLVRARAWWSRRGIGRAAQSLFPELVGVSDRVLEVKRLMAQVAGSDATVLVTGESGTGKEVVARCLHRASERASQPFVPVNCGAIPGELLESELFGHEKGAFTGALEAKKGRFELAHGGTLFLDEIGDMPLPMQVKLLRAIQEKAVERIGSARAVPCDVRIVAATHQDLESLIDQGLFREDLYYRLAVFPIALPPLRERADDVELIARELLAELRRSEGAGVGFSTAAWQALKAYGWPGNVRELKNLVQRMAIQFPDAVVGVEDLPPRLRQGALQAPAATAGPVVAGESAGAPVEPVGASVMLPVNGIDLRAFLGDLERSLIEQALNDADSVVARAADRLHIRRTTLVEKMRKYGIRRGEV